MASSIFSGSPPPPYSGSPPPPSDTDSIADHRGKEAIERCWRHTAGRISCLSRIPFYALAALWQLPKMGLKFVVSVVQLGANGVKGCIYRVHNLFASEENHWTFKKWQVADGWSFKGIVRDGTIGIHLLRRMGSSSLLTLVAPPKQYVSLKKALTTCWNFNIKGTYHRNHKSPISPSELRKLLSRTRPDLGWQAFSCYQSDDDSRETETSPNNIRTDSESTASYQNEDEEEDGIRTDSESTATSPPSSPGSTRRKVVYCWIHG